MGDKPWDDAEKLAEALYHGGEEHSREEAAEYLGCSAGTISLRLNHKEHYGVEEVDEYGPEDFEVEPADFEASELAELVHDRIVRTEDAEITDAHTVVSRPLDLVVGCVDGSLPEVISELEDTDYSNRYVAISESYPFDKDSADVPDDIHVIIVDGDFEVLSDRLDVPNAHFVFEGESAPVDYRNEVWLRYELEHRGAEKPELLERCSVLPRTLDQYLFC